MWNDAAHQSKNEFVHPEDTTFWMTKVMAFWITPLIKLASERQLLETDVWDCPASQTVSHDSKIIRDAWTHEKQRATAEKRKPDLLWALYDGFGTDFVLAGFYQFFFMCAQLAQPFLVGELVAYISTGDGGIRRGVGFALGLAAVSLVSSIALSTTFYSLRRLGVAVRSGVMMAVYEQALKLTSASRLQNTVGQTTNLMSIDSEKLFLACQFIHFLWHGPLTGIAVMCILIKEVGYAPALAGMGWILLLIPTQNYFAEQIGAIRRKMVKFTDERVKLMNEVLQAIRVIKVYAWEVPMEQRIDVQRQKEMRYLNWYLLASSRLRELLFSAQPVAALIIFATLVYGQNQKMDVVQVFRVLAFLNITRFPLNLLAQALKNFNDGKVSLYRLNRFFLLPVLETSAGHNVKLGPGEHPYVSLEDATFSWSIESGSVSASSVKQQKQGSDKKGSAAVHSPAIKGAISNVSSSSSPSTPFQLSNLSFRTRQPNELIAVIGQVGSGKSSFVSALLNEIPLLSGSCAVAGCVSYCAQTPWIQNMSLKDNVCFGVDSSSEDREVQLDYERAIDASALRHDIKILPHGDQTEIGERGINLSGGQKARVSIARALFSAYRSQLFLLDDPFSAVDGATGNWIFEHGVVRHLGDKLRIVVLNSHMHLVKRFDRVIVLENGVIAADGSPAELLVSHGELLARITGISGAGAEESNADGSPAETCDVDVELLTKPIESGEDIGAKGALNVGNTAKADAAAVVATPAADSPDKSKTEKVLVQSEKVSASNIGSAVFIKYFAAALLPLNHFAQHPMFSPESYVDFRSSAQLAYGVVIALGMLVIFSVAQLARLAVDFYLARWAMADGGKYSVWGTVYFVSLGCLGFMLVVRSLFLNYFVVRSGLTIHSALLRSILCAPIPTFFDTHTIGEILNRFGKDTEIVDSSVPETLLQILINWSQVISIFALCIWASYYFAIVMLPLLLGFFVMFKYFSNVSQSLKKLEAVSRSPIYASLSETLLGLETIRAYGDTDRFLLTHRKRMDRNQKFFFHLWMCMSWVTVRLELATSFILLSIAIISVCLRDHISPIALGLALSYGLQLTALFQRCVQISIDMANYMTSTERLFEYLDVPHEDSIAARAVDKSGVGGILKSADGTDRDSNAEKGGGSKNRQQGQYEMVPMSTSINDAPASWPGSGSIEFDQVWMQYRDNPPVLRGISFQVSKGERIGVCGRTGAGKSSVMTALFRVVEVTSGRILIDGVDIATVPLQQLRSNLAIIPQDPVLFTGSIRYQLDPFDQYSDLQVWDSLQQVNMADTVKGLPGGICEEVKENGENLSQGQRQLLCIARALLRRTQILIVDEGTSAVDPYTDELIQKVLREVARTQGTTVLAIAHRLQTIVDFDRILVLGAGQILEFDTPERLLGDKDSVFAGMIREADH